MPNVNTSYQVIRQMLGKQGKAVLEKKEFLSAIEKVDKDLASRIEQSVEGVTNPMFELSGKSTANYNIASLRIKSGDKVIGTGAVSRSTQDIAKAGELKGRLDLPNGDILRMESDLSSIDREISVYLGKDKNLVKTMSTFDDSYTKYFERPKYKDDINTLREVKMYNPYRKEYKIIYGGVSGANDVKITKLPSGGTKIIAISDNNKPIEYIIDKNGLRRIEKESSVQTIYDANGKYCCTILPLTEKKPYHTILGRTRSTGDDKFYTENFDTWDYFVCGGKDEMPVPNLNNPSLMNRLHGYNQQPINEWLNIYENPNDKNLVKSIYNEIEENFTKIKNNISDAMSIEKQ